MTGVPRLVRAVVGLIALAVIASLVWGWFGEYRAERVPEHERAAEVTPTPEPVENGDAEEVTAEEPGEPADETPEPTAETGRTVVVTIEGLSFRRGPSREAERISTLTRGTRLEYLGTENGWYRVRHSDGTEGYVSASEQYTELQ